MGCLPFNTYQYFLYERRALACVPHHWERSATLPTMLTLLVSRTRGWQPLYRGVRCKLANGADSLLDRNNGMHVAVEFGFMSTSLDRNVCVQYMDDSGPNVLWELLAQQESEPPSSLSWTWAMCWDTSERWLLCLSAETATALSLLGRRAMLASTSAQMCPSSRR